MPAPRIRADYEQLKQIARAFGLQADSTRKSLNEIKRAQAVLQSGEWIGQGAKAFYREMDSEVTPSLTRLVGALDHTSTTTAKIAQIVQKAEDDAAALFKAAASAALAAAAGAVAGAVAGASAGKTGPAASVTPAQAKKIFTAMSKQKDIAFNYPRDGCYARAHLMNERIRQTYGVEPSKVWAFGDLRVESTTPYKTVRWGYHVAPAIPVSQPDGSTQMMVIDPSIASQPVTVEGWAAIMHTSAGNTQVTPSGTPPTHPSTGQRVPGTGYWPSQDPTAFGGPDGYSNEVMRRYKECGNTGANCQFVPPR